MASWFIKGNTDWTSPNFHIAFYIDINGFDEGSYDSQVIGSNGETGDPFFALGLTTPNTLPGSFSYGQQRVELGLLASNRIIFTSTEVGLQSGYDPTGKSDYSIATKKYVDDVAGGGVSALSDLSDVGSVGYTSGHVLIANGTDTYNSGQLAHSQLGSVSSDQHHPRQHSISSSTDHTMTANRIIYSNNSAVITQLALGSSNYYLKSQGATSALIFAQVQYSELGGVPSSFTPSAHALSVSGGYHTGSLSLTDLGSYAAGRIIYGGASDWTYLSPGTNTYVLKMGATYPAWGQVDRSELTNHDNYTTTPHVSSTEKTTWNGKIAHISEDATPQLSADLDLNTKGISMNGTPSDDKYEGIILEIDTTGCTVGQAVYVDGTNSVLPADADAIGTMPCIGIVVGTGKVLTHGVYRDDSVFALATASKVYVSTTAGALTTTAPSGTGDIIQIVGVTIGPDILLVNPSLDWVKHK